MIANAGATTPMQLRLAWITPEQRAATFNAAVSAAREARAVVVFAYNEGTEGTDRTSLVLPRNQDALVQALANVNRKTVVVLNTGDPVTMPWLENVRAILETWYPGQEGGDATAELLLGEVNPSGKLPVTFPARLEDNPTYSADGRRYPGIPATGPGAEEFYDEGIFVGYRWYDANHIPPLFPFGHGLSYTKFDYLDLETRRDGSGFEVSFIVRNAGSVRGAEAPQIYLGRSSAVPAGVQMAEQALVAFDRIELRPGDAKRIKLHIDKRALSYWSSAQDDWVIAGGKRAVYVGASSRDIRLRGRIEVGDDGDRSAH
jgi:beta-glucosidase